MFLSLDICFQDNALAKVISGQKLPPHIIVDESLFQLFWAPGYSGSASKLCSVVVSNTLLRTKMD